jgi:hypothetical protein
MNYFCINYTLIHHDINRNKLFSFLFYFLHYVVSLYEKLCNFFLLTWFKHKNIELGKKIYNVTM